MNHEEIRKLATDQTEMIGDIFVEEVNRLLRSGAISEQSNASIVFGVALENIAVDFIGSRKSGEYKNLQLF